MADPADVNPYRMTLDELEESTGHAAGEALLEIEPEVEQRYRPPMRVTPMSPASEIQALGQMTQAPPHRKRQARVAALVLLGLMVVLPLTSWLRELP